MVSTNQVDEPVSVDGPAMLYGVMGSARWAESEGRLVFTPSAEGIASQAYRDTLALVGEAWSEWVIEVDVQVEQKLGVWVIEV